MVAQAVVLAEILPAALSRLAIGIGGTVAAGTILKNFDKTSREICACLGTIDRTLISGFAGLGIKIDQLPGPLVGSRHVKQNALTTRCPFNHVGILI